MTLTVENSTSVVQGGEYAIRIVVDLPAEAHVPPGEPFELSAWAEVRPRAGLTVAWETSTDEGDTWVPIALAVDPVYSLEDAGLIPPGSWYRAVFTAADHSTATTSECVYINPLLPPEE